MTENVTASTNTSTQKICPPPSKRQVKIQTPESDQQNEKPPHQENIQPQAPADQKPQIPPLMPMHFSNNPMQSFRPRTYQPRQRHQSLTYRHQFQLPQHPLPNVRHNFESYAGHQQQQVLPTEAQWSHQTTATQMTTPQPQMTYHTPSFTNQRQQYHAYTPLVPPSLTTQNGSQMLLIEKPCYLFFVEYVPNQPTPILQAGQPQQTTDFRYTPATSNTGTPNSTFQF